VRDADLILVVDEGIIVAQGRHDELVVTSALYNEILGSQIQTEPPKLRLEGGHFECDAMRRPGGIEQLAELEVERAARRGAIAKRLLARCDPREQAAGRVWIHRDWRGRASRGPLPGLAGHRPRHRRRRWIGLLESMALLLAVYVIGALAQRDKRGEWERPGSTSSPPCGSGSSIICSACRSLFRSPPHRRSDEPVC